MNVEVLGESMRETVNYMIPKMFTSGQTQRLSECDCYVKRKKGSTGQQRSNSSKVGIMVDEIWRGLRGEGSEITK